MPSSSRRPRGRRHSGRPGPTRRSAAHRSRPTRPQPAPPGSLRRAVERRSARALIALHTRPRWVPFLLVLGLLLTGLAVEGAVGSIALLVLAALLGWLLYLSWPVLDRRARAVRMGVLGAVVGLLVGRLLL